MKTNRNNKPLDWQKDPTKITTDKVQLWRNGIMVTAMLKNSDAREMITSGRAFVITSQAVGALTNKGEYNA